VVYTVRGQSQPRPLWLNLTSGASSTSIQLDVSPLWLHQTVQYNILSPRIRSLFIIAMRVFSSQGTSNSFFSVLQTSLPRGNSEAVLPESNPLLKKQVCRFSLLSGRNGTCCHLVSHGEYADETDGRTPDRYIALLARRDPRNVEGTQWRIGV